MPDSNVVISTVAAVVSAIGGAFATVAAFRSAGSARVTQDAAAASEKLAALRQLMVAANEVLVEARRAESRGNDLKLSYHVLFTFAGSSGGSREKLYVDATEGKLAEATAISARAKPYSSDLDLLLNGPLEEITGREIKVAQMLTEIRAIREDLEREHASVEGQCAEFRKNAFRHPLG